MKAIINRTLTFGSLNGVITPNADIYKVVFSHLKNGTARLVIDSDDTLMYILS